VKFLLDTCVISELVASRPNEGVVAWVDTLDPAAVYLSAITVGEIRKGIEKLDDSPRKERLREWLEEDLLARFSGRILSIDAGVMLAWGELVSGLERKGRKMPAMDSLIAATVLHGGLMLATRNEDDFRDSGISVVNPWK
jgi:predicted nucleic acid-binding protein